jgi:sugar lactone lactonase YvrE
MIIWTVWRHSITLGIGLAVTAFGLSGLAAGATASAVTLPGECAFPESITSTLDGTLYVGSIGEGGVFRVRPGAAQAESWIKPGAFGSRSVAGVLADERSGTLWICSNDLSAYGVTTPGSETGSTLKGFDLKTGEGKVSAKLPGELTQCNDMAVGSDGSVYVTNTKAPQILMLRPGSRQLELWLTDSQFQPAKGAGLDGIAFGGDGNLYLNTYTLGELFRVDVKNGIAGKVTKLQTSRALAMADGLRPVGGNVFLMIEGAGRLDRVVIDGDTASIETIKEGLLGPTGVTLNGNTAWVSEGQLASLFGSANGKKGPTLPFQVSAAALPAP